MCEFVLQKKKILNELIVNYEILQFLFLVSNILIIRKMKISQ